MQIALTDVVCGCFGGYLNKVTYFYEVRFQDIKGFPGKERNVVGGSEKISLPSKSTFIIEFFLIKSEMWLWHFVRNGPAFYLKWEMWERICSEPNLLKRCFHEQIGWRWANYTCFSLWRKCWDRIWINQEKPATLSFISLDAMATYI